MDENEVKTLVMSSIEGADVSVKLNGNSCQIGVVAPQFEGIRTLKRQQLVYGCINDRIASGELHAVTLHTYSPSEWEKQKMFGMPF